jgi:hypothetical protein
MATIMNDSTSENSQTAHHISGSIQRALEANDLNITLQEYMYYAKISRKQESDMDVERSLVGGFLAKVIGKAAVEPVTMIAAAPVKGVDEKDDKMLAPALAADIGVGSSALISGEEWDQAARAGRTAT